MVSPNRWVLRNGSETLLYSPSGFRHTPSPRGKRNRYVSPVRGFPKRRRWGLTWYPEYKLSGRELFSDMTYPRVATKPETTAGRMSIAFLSHVKYWEVRLAMMMH